MDSRIKGVMTNQDLVLSKEVEKVRSLPGKQEKEEDEEEEISDLHEPIVDTPNTQPSPSRE